MEDIQIQIMEYILFLGTENIILNCEWSINNWIYVGGGQLKI